MQLFHFFLWLVSIHFAVGTCLIAQDEIVWQRSFSSPSAVDEPLSKVMVVITSDDSDGEYDFSSARNPKVPLFWCQSNVQQAVSNAIKQQPDLLQKTDFQVLHVGIPNRLTGGKDRNKPSRCVVAICDRQFRLLSLGVGVPDSNYLLTLLEDADQVLSLMQLKSQEFDDAELTKALVQRGQERLNRLWSDTLTRLLKNPVPFGDDPDSSATQRKRRFLELHAPSLEELYLVDINLRFSLADADDRLRLLQLEQHFQTRRPWCETVQPFLVGIDFQLAWRDVCESIWRIDTIDAWTTDDDLVAWFESKAGQPVVLRIKPTLLQRSVKWPPPDAGNVASRRGLSWSKLDELVDQFENRTVSAQQLAILFKDRFTDVDIQSPSRARYAVIKPNEKKPWLICESDLPASSIGRIKRLLPK